MISTCSDRINAIFGSASSAHSSQSCVNNLQQNFGYMTLDPYNTQQVKFPPIVAQQGLQREYGKRQKTNTPVPASRSQSRSQSRQSLYEENIMQQIMLDDPVGRILSIANRLKAVLFIDLDNISSFFQDLPSELPNNIFIIGFSGGKIEWKPVRCVALNSHLDRKLFALVKHCGEEKGATDEKLVSMAYKLDRNFNLPYHITFLIVSGDGGYYNYIQEARRHVQIINPHQKVAKKQIYHAILNHVKH